MCDSAALNPDPTSEGAEQPQTLRNAPGLTRRAGDDEHGEFYCGEGDSDDDEDGARAAALERFDAILQIDAGRFADDDDGDEEGGGTEMNA